MPGLVNAALPLPVFIDKDGQTAKAQCKTVIPLPLQNITSPEEISEVLRETASSSYAQPRRRDRTGKNSAAKRKLRRQPHLSRQDTESNSKSIDQSSDQAEQQRRWWEDVEQDPVGLAETARQELLKSNKKLRKRGRIERRKSTQAFSLRDVVEKMSTFISSSSESSLEFPSYSKIQRSQVAFPYSEELRIMRHIVHIRSNSKL